ncbi:gliding motility-associated C-terminal domain-containing protein [Sporocytophaga myxococcoides]|uniref:gliding motility-associated C-terminal domain-containing protein n=1 Tax=Sporocytophaga myxococcoides TaxID=153721 RepID=UPI0003F84D74|nr:gliding motility-associated C-terminal domain-containing protein [Sporocytophaga myxococcoides]
MSSIKKHIAYCLLILIAPLTGLAQTYYIKDDGFRQCLTDLEPTLVNSQKELDINAAANFTHDIICINYKMSNVDGIQYFINTKRLSLTHNQLSSLEEISGLTKLEEITINENTITQLPNLSNFNNLKSIDASNNALSNAPNLPVPSSLMYLNLSQNNLPSFPDLSNQLNLTYLNLAGNINIKVVPKLPVLIKLEELHLYYCGLNEAPVISNLSNLKILNLGFNYLKTLPDFSANQQLKSIFANDNMLESFASMNSLPNLEKVGLLNNYLSYEDFIPLLNIPTFRDIYKIAPQKTFPNPLFSNYLEYDTINLKTGIANQIAGVNYSWYYNNNRIWTGNADTLSFPNSSISQSGDYYFTLNHPDFPDLPITSAVKNVTISECLIPSHISKEVTGATCVKPGSIKVSPGLQPKNNLSYILESKSTKIQVTSKDGNFNNLNNPEYRLYAKAGDRCIKLIDDKIILPIEACKEAFFSPNNDGISDIYFFTQQGKAKVFNKWGQVIQELSVPVEWDGRLKDNSIIQTGYYTIEINNGEEKFHLSVVY